MSDSSLVLSWLAEHPEIDAETRRAVLAAPVEVFADGRMVPYDPRDYQWSAAEAWKAAADADCRECYEARPYTPGQEHFGWALWLTCGGPGRCGHAHHRDEIWMAAVAGVRRELPAGGRMSQ